jgi:wyosine [tRNA(Phe)-imidazoG37] synthetase (radical SAM superfamily)
MSRIFGPVPSRRLGRSLGIDLVPYKTCTYDCVYCQLGRTTRRTVERRSWVPIAPLFRELERKRGCEPDYVTLGGSGEPTLHSRIATVIRRAREIVQAPVAVLTNGALLHRPEVRRDLRGADLVLPSLDAGDEESFRLVNRPCPSLDFETMVEGLVAFRREFAGPCWLEVFLIEGSASSKAAIERLSAHVSRIAPDRVLLNTLARPPAEAWVRGLPPEKMAEIASRFDPPAEVIADASTGAPRPDPDAGENEVRGLLERRPCSVEQIAEGLGMHRNEVLKHLERLGAEGELHVVRTAGRDYYRVQAEEGT